jgi:hypothetical protein
MKNTMKNNVTEMTTTELRNRVAVAETKGRKLLLSNINVLFPDAEKIYLSEGQYDKWDVAIESSNGSRYLIEIKFRNMSSTRYSDYMIEEEKFDYLLSKTKKGITSIYLNFFDDAKALMWEINNDSMYDNRVYTSDKVNVNPNAGKITRSRNMLPASHAKKFDIDLNVTPF